MNYPTARKKHDMNLSDWGPYSKVLAGVSHIEDRERGEMLEFCIFPGQFRGPVHVPWELWQDSHYPWYANSDLSLYTYRFELEWKDRVYADVSYRIQDENSVYVKIECVNNTEMEQNICLHYLANRTRTECPEVRGLEYLVDPLSYDEIELKMDHPTQGLLTGGRLQGEERRKEYVSGHALGDLFGRKAGDRVKYTVDCRDYDRVFLHVKGKGDLKISGNPDSVICVDSDTFTFLSAPVNFGDTLEITCLTEGGVVIDAIGFGREDSAWESVPIDVKPRPQIEENGSSVLFTYEEMKNCYGLAWQGEMYAVRELQTDNLTYFMQATTQNHVSKVLGGDRKNQYTDVFVRPIPLKPAERKVFYGLICCGERETVAMQLESFQQSAEIDGFEQPPLENTRYALGQRLMKATLLTNVVFPIRLQSENVRHFTPGKCWNSLYTWDNGFIAMAFCDFAPALAKECLNMYLTEEGNIHCAYIQQGSVVPVQAYVYKRLFDVTNDKDFLRELYPSMKQYYEFYVGKNPDSHTKDLKSGLLCTFRYFYNSGGWDDYPPQKYVHSIRDAEHYTPVVNTAHGINFARIMIQAAQVLGYETKEYVADMEAFKAALQAHSYDSKSGYFGYVHHDENGEPDEILRHASGQNYNMGMDGAYPALVGACTPQQREVLIERIMSKEHMWTAAGISVVDQSAAYYSREGYWNGSVWFPHQWFAFLGMLENAYDTHAEKIAVTALELWKKETEYSYRCCEHFMVESRRGAGWQCFGGLSSPVVMWHECMYQKGNVTLPVNLHVQEKVCEENKMSFTVVPYAWEEGVSSVIAVPHSKPQRVSVNGQEVSYTGFGDGILIHVSKADISRMEIIW